MTTMTKSETGQATARYSLQHRGDLGEYHVNAEDGSTIARCDKRAHAALIVRAVNAHDELVAALRELLRCSAIPESWAEPARAALAKVTT